MVGKVAGSSPDSISRFVSVLGRLLFLFISYPQRPIKNKILFRKAFRNILDFYFLRNEFRDSTYYSLFVFHLTPKTIMEIAMHCHSSQLVELLDTGSWNITLRSIFNSS